MGLRKGIRPFAVRAASSIGRYRWRPSGARPLDGLPKWAASRNRIGGRLLKAAKARQECLTAAAKVPAQHYKLSTLDRARGRVPHPRVARAPRRSFVPPTGERRGSGGRSRPASDDVCIMTGVPQIAAD